MVICFEDQETGRCLKRSPSGDQNFITKMRIIDFGSAIDEFTLKHLYGSTGPSRAEQTYEYTLHLKPCLRQFGLDHCLWEFFKTSSLNGPIEIQVLNASEFLEDRLSVDDAYLRHPYLSYFQSPPRGFRGSSGA
ncbi:hypothetical protein CMV_020135 [Castanea mollissima]|uniref:Uncharacterized protein n=1 Tax=Castanea mollissima TaxID=60419 RepID=A0A8J4VDX6_9ROSI|nr:hypothetical protein CMV_020135 [Castanea mollissima]